MGSFFPRLHSPQWIVSVWHYTRAVLEKGLKRFFSQFHMCLLLRLLCASNQTLEYFIFFAILLVEFLMHLVIFVKRQKSRPSFKKVASYSCAQTFLSSHKTFSLQKENTGLWWLATSSCFSFNSHSTTFCFEASASLIMKMRLFKTRCITYHWI